MRKILLFTVMCIFVFISASCLFESQAVPVMLQKESEKTQKEEISSEDEMEESENKTEENQEEKPDTAPEENQEEDTETKTEENQEEETEKSPDENQKGDTDTKSEENQEEDIVEKSPDENQEKETEKSPDENQEEVAESNPEDNPDEDEEIKPGEKQKEDIEKEIEKGPEEVSGEETGKDKNEESTTEEEKENPPVDVIEELPVHRDWTFMVYMGADNSLEPYAIQDLNEMEAGIEKGGSTTVLALVDRIPGFDDSNGNWAGTRLYEIKRDEKGKNTGIESKRISCPDLGIGIDSDTELNLASGTTLSFFVDFVKKEYESDHYCLIIWGNGGGWRGCVSDESSSLTMPLPELRKSLEGKGLDAVVFDTSFGLSIETLYELKDTCRFVAGTPGVNSESGIDYEKFLKEFCAGSKTMGSFLEKICSASGADFHSVSLTNMQNVMDSLNDTGKALSDYIKSRNVQKQIFENLLLNGKTYCNGNYPCDLYISLSACIDYFLTLNNIDVINAARKLQSALQKLSVSGESVSPSVFLIPVISRGIAVSRHPESYVVPDGKNSDGILRCSFVTNGTYWVPTGKNISFMDSLFYRSF